MVQWSVSLGHAVSRATDGGSMAVLWNVNGLTDDVVVGRESNPHRQLGRLELCH